MNANPFRYRGYYYDKETGLYYLNSRYYDSETGRFINADDPTMLFETAGIVGGANLYSYCLNNPVMYTDPSGHFPWLIAILIAVSVGSVAYSAYEYINNPSTENALWLALDLLPIPIPLGTIAKGGKAAYKVIDKYIDATKAFEKAGGVIKYASKADFTDDAWKLVKGLDRSSGFTRSSAIMGTKIHKGYRGVPHNIPGGRLDGIDHIAKAIYELKPNNIRNIKKGINQLVRYQKGVASQGLGVYQIILLLY